MAPEAQNCVLGVGRHVLDLCCDPVQWLVHATRRADQAVQAGLYQHADGRLSPRSTNRDVRRGGGQQHTDAGAAALLAAVHAWFRDQARTEIFLYFIKSKHVALSCALLIANVANSFAAVAEFRSKSKLYADRFLHYYAAVQERVRGKMRGGETFASPEGC